MKRDCVDHFNWNYKLHEFLVHRSISQLWMLPIIMVIGVCCISIDRVQCKRFKDSIAYRFYSYHGLVGLINPSPTYH